MKTGVNVTFVMALILFTFTGNLFAKNHSCNNKFKKKLLYQEHANVTEMRTFGVAIEDVQTGMVPIPPQGMRLDTSFEGKITGMITGDITGVDYLTMYPDGWASVDIRATIETEDGHRIAVHRKGRLIPRPSDPMIADLYEPVTLSTMAEPYLWVNDLSIIAIGTFNYSRETIHLKLYACDADASLLRNSSAKFCDRCN